MLTDEVSNNKASPCDSTENEVLSLLDDVIDDVIYKERQSNKVHKSTSTLFRCDDPSEIAIAYSYQEMNRIVEEYQNQTGIEFHKIYYGISNASKYYLIGPFNSGPYYAIAQCYSFLARL